jgi:hypothetical protein
MKSPGNHSFPELADIGTFSSGGVPVRRTPIGLARLFFQICSAAAAEPLATTGLTPLQFGALVYLSRETGEPDIDQNGLAAWASTAPARVRL